MFKGKIFIVSGASNGIGRACALMLGERGANVGLIDIASPGDVKAEIEAAGGQALAIQCDISSSTQVEEAVKAVVDKFGLLDG